MIVHMPLTVHSKDWSAKLKSTEGYNSPKNVCIATKIKLDQYFIIIFQQSLLSCWPKTQIYFNSQWNRLCNGFGFCTESEDTFLITSYIYCTYALRYTGSHRVECTSCYNLCKCNNDYNIVCKTEHKTIIHGWNGVGAKIHIIVIIITQKGTSILTHGKLEIQKNQWTWLLHSNFARYWGKIEKLLGN